MKNLKLDPDKNQTKIKSIAEVMQHAYHIAETSGFYSPLNKEDWAEN